MGNDDSKVSQYEAALRNMLKKNMLLSEKLAVFSEPIAIIGIGCRFPGNSNTPEAFWEFLKSGADGVSEIPSDRFDIDSYYDPEPGKKGKIVTRKGAFLKDIDLFDPAFFGISPIEAEMMDPQQRLLLHVTWEAIERAGIPPRTLKNSVTGVFVGVSNNDYGALLARTGDSGVSPQSASGNALNAISGRVSYCFGFQGPSMVVDTACSSSLVAVHTACESLHMGDCDLAIGGGVNILLDPQNFIALSAAQMLSPDGHCKTFDASADGYVRGEGIGVVVLKRLADAKRDGNPILAIIRGSAVNQDGPSSGLTVPNGVAQAKLIRQALKSANLQPTDITYVEAHGTGTSLGDPIEVNAITEAYGAARAEPLLLGSIKSNIGHLESAAGISSLIKVILSLKHKEIPANLRFTTLNPKINLEKIPAKIVTQLTPWMAKKRIAGVSGFGFTGTNAHLIVEEAPVAVVVSKETEVTPFKYQHIWSDLARVKPKTAQIAMNRHPFLARRLDTPGMKDIVYESTIDFHWPEFVSHHLIYGYPVIAGAGYISALLSAINELSENGAGIISDLDWIRPLVFSKGEVYTLQIILHPQEEKNKYRFEVISRKKDDDEALDIEWLTHSTGRVTTSDEKFPEYESIEKIKSRLKTHYDGPFLYNEVTPKISLDLGPHFRWIEEVNVSTDETLAKMRFPESLSESTNYLLYPGFIDSIFQTGFAFMLQSGNINILSIPLFIEKIVYDSRSGYPRWVHSKRRREGNEELFDFVLLNEHWQPIGEFRGFRTREVPKEALVRALGGKESLIYEWIWQEHELEKVEALPGRWVRDEFDSSADGVIYSGKSLEEVLHVTQEFIKQQLQIPLVLIISEDLFQSTISGFFKTALLEHPVLKLKLIHVASESPLLNAAILDPEPYLKLDGDKCYVPRFVKEADAKTKRHELTRPQDDQFRLETREKGLIENLTLVPLKLKETPAADEVEVEVHAVGLNFRDVLNALGLYPGNPGPLGGDAAGIVLRTGSNVKNLKPGDKVFGMMMGGALARKVYAHRDDIALIPKEMSFVDAAALPVVFLTAYFAFTRCTQLKQGDVVLIHAAAGGVGVAAIQLAKYFGATVIATAGSEKKKEFLRQQGVEHIFDSRSLSYGKDIEKLTEGRGVDVVLNSLSGKGFIETTVGICKKGASFLEIGKRDIWTKEEMRPDINYHIIAIDDMAINQPERIQEMLQELLPIMKPIPITTFPIERAVDAFTYMQTAKHIGKIVITLEPRAPIAFDPHGTYLITGGKGGLGTVLDTWLKERGAGNVILAGRAMLDVSSEIAVKEFLARTPNLKGIFHLAGILDDAVIAEQDWPHFEKVFGPKVYGTYNLHKYSKNLDYFVTFSSISSSMGSPGQSNYAAANAFMDALCIMRKGQGLPALSISWGPWAKVGMAKDLVARHAKSGMLGIDPEEGMHALESALLSSHPHLTVVNLNWKNYLKQMIEVPSWYEAFSEKKETKENLQALLEGAPVDQRIFVLKAYVSNIVKGILGLSSVDENKGFFDMGLDSLMAVELKNRLQAGIGKVVILATTAVFDHSTIEKMALYLGEILKLGNIKVKKREVALPTLQTEEPIAIIGMSCRFPGGANNPQQFWELLEQGKDAIIEVPSDRWDPDSFYDPDPGAPGKMITKLGGFLNIDVSQFDAEFFKVSPREAEFMDPQQRLLLELTYEALLSTGIEPTTLAGSQTGVFVGICSRDYWDLINESGDKNIINPYMGTGNAVSTATGRISYFFDFQGPNFAVDTACSSSLVAIDQAFEALRNGSANLALAGGVNLILAPNLSIDFSKAGMLAPDGHCKTFDASANGYVRGEGCGMIVLKRLSDAQRDGNNILAVIKASSINQDGASSGLTVPNGEAQEALINTVLAKAGLKGDQISYVEAHGTGTSLGDPIEMRAIGATYGIRKEPLLLGSVKTNIGHLEGAAGIASVIKVVLALQHEKLPKQLHFKQINPNINVDFPVEILTSNRDWKKKEHPRRAAVSSFGFSGTNAHLIIEEGASTPLEYKVPIYKRKRYWLEAVKVSDKSYNLHAELILSIEQLPESEQKQFVLNFISTALKHIVGISKETFRPEILLQEYGMDSIMIADLRNLIASNLGVSLEISDIQPDSNSNDLSSLIVSHFKKAAPSEKIATHDHRQTTVLKTSKEKKFQLFVIPPLGFGEASFVNWIHKLSDDIELIYLGQQFKGSWDEMIAHMANEVKNHIEMPFIIYGHSMGGVVAYEIARYLEEKMTLYPAAIILSSVVPPEQFSRIKYAFPFNETKESTPSTNIEKLIATHYLPPKNIPMRLVSPNEINADAQAIIYYSKTSFEPIQAPIFAIQTNNDVLIRDGDLVSAWKSYTKSYFSYTEIEGTHMFFINPPQLVFEIIQKAFNVPQFIPSVYKLKECVQGSNNNTTFPLGFNPQGFLLYDEATQTVSAHLWHSHAENAECSIVDFMNSYFSYCGRYEIQSGVIYHQVALSLLPNLTNDVLKRDYDYDKDNLILSTMERTAEHQIQEPYTQLTWEPLPLVAQNCPWCGSWTLSYYSENDKPVLGEVPIGQLIVLNNGYFAMHMSNRQRDNFKNNNPALATEHELHSAYKSYRSYFGRFVFEDSLMKCTILSPGYYNPHLIAHHEGNKLVFENTLDLQIKSVWEMQKSQST